MYAPGSRHSRWTPPDAREWRRRFDAVIGSGLPFLTAEMSGDVAGYAYCAQWTSRPAYRHTVEDSVHVAPDSVGYSVAGRLLDALLAGCVDAAVRQVIAIIVDADAGVSLRCSVTAASPTRAG